MDAIILDKVQAHYPRLKGLVENYRSRREEAVALAIIDTIFSSDNRWFSRAEILYLATVKAHADRRVRAAHENLELRIKHAQRIRRLDDGVRTKSANAETDPEPQFPARRFYVVRNETVTNNNAKRSFPLRII